MAITSSAGVFDFCTCDIAIWTILTVVACVVLFLATGPYYYYLSVAPDVAQDTAIFIVSAATVMVLSILGIYGALKKKKGVLLYFALIMMVMLSFTAVQIALTFVALSNCADTSQFFHFMCNVEQAVFFAHSTIIIIVAIMCSVSAYLLRRRLQKQEEDPDNKY